MQIIKTLIKDMYDKYRRFYVAILIAGIAVISNAQAIPALNLLSNENFVILAGAAVTGLSPFNISGNVGLSPAAGSNITGFSGVNVSNGFIYTVDASGPAGSVQNSVLLQAAKSDLTIAYNDAAGRTPVPTGPYLNPGGGNMGGLNLTEGLYKFTSEAAVTGADLTLTGSSTDVWIFQIATSLDIGSGIHIILAGGAQASNIFWQVGSSATLGTYCVFKGTILADQSVSLSTGASMDGRALAFSGAVTMGSGVTTSRPVPLFPVFVVNPTTLNYGNVSNGVNKIDSVVVSNTGTSNLIISSVTSSNPLFNFTPSNLTIIPSGTQKYYITFSPLAIGAQSSLIIFNHNDSGLKDTVWVSGTGVAPLSPIFVVNPTSINYGSVITGITKRDSVTVSNTGTSNLIISSVTSSNPLFTFTPSNLTIIPSGTQKYYITFSPLAIGAQSSLIIFNHNDSGLKDTVWVNGSGVAPLFPLFVVDPTTLNYGNVTTGNNKIDSVVVSNTGTSDLIISSVTSSNPLFTFTPSNLTITPSGTQQYYITFSPLAVGAQSSLIIFNHNDSGLKDTVWVNGTGVAPLSPIFVVNPTSINYGSVITGITKRDSVTVTNAGTSNLIISSVTSSNPLFTFTPSNLTIIPNGTQKYYITFSPLAVGVQSSLIIFNHNDSGLKDTLIVNGIGLAPLTPIFTVNPTSINFGNVITGTTKLDSVTVRNIGTSNLVISGVMSSNSNFSFTPGNFTIAPGEGQKYYIVFAPISNGPQSSMIIFSHNDSGLKDTVWVNGAGLDPLAPIFTANPTSINFGNVQTYSSKINSLRVTNIGNSNLIINTITSTNIHFTIDNESSTLLPNGSREFYIKFSPTSPGPQSSYIIFNSNSSEAKDSIYVYGIGIEDNLSPICEISPTSIDFGNVNMGSKKTDSVMVKNTGLGILYISNVSLGTAAFSVFPKMAVIYPGGSYKFYLTFTPIVTGVKNSSAYFYHNGVQGMTEVKVRGNGVEADTSAKFVICCPLDIKFDSVRIGNTKQKTVCVSNVGTATLRINSVSIVDSQYSIYPTMVSIEPGATFEFTVTFAPLQVGLIESKIIFIHNAGIDAINATGIGVENLPVITMHEARNLPLGTEFVVEGFITRAMGIYSRIQDSTAALTIIQDSGVFFDEVRDFDIRMTDLVRIQGRISEINNLKVIVGNDLIMHQRLSRFNVPLVAKEVTLLELANNGEKYESQLITIDNLSIASLGDINFRGSNSYNTSDASDITNSVIIRIGNLNDTEIDGMPFLSTNVKFEGVLSQSNAIYPTKGYQLTPILSTDLRKSSSAVDGTLPQSTISDNYPNPFSTTTSIKYHIEMPELVSLKVYNSIGEEITTLVNAYQEAGQYTVQFNSDSNASDAACVYYYRLIVGTQIFTKQMVLVK